MASRDSVLPPLRPSPSGIPRLFPSDFSPNQELSRSRSLTIIPCRRCRYTKVPSPPRVENCEDRKYEKHPTLRVIYFNFKLLRQQPEIVHTRQRRSLVYDLYTGIHLYVPIYWITRDDVHDLMYVHESSPTQNAAAEVASN